MNKLFQKFTFFITRNESYSIIFFCSFLLFGTLLTSTTSISSVESSIWMIFRTLVFIFLSASIYLADSSRLKVKNIGSFFFGIYLIDLMGIIIDSLFLSIVSLDLLFNFIYTLLGLFISLFTILVVIEQIMIIRKINKAFYSKIMIIAYQISDLFSLPFKKLLDRIKGIN